MGRSPSSISREVRRNCAQYLPKHAYHYHHWRAEIFAICPISASKTHLRRKEKTVIMSIIIAMLSTPTASFPNGSIPEWSEEIKNRARLGDWEGDAVYGGVGKGLIVTLADRKSRF